MAKISSQSILRVVLGVLIILIVTFFSGEGIIRDIIMLILVAMLAGILSTFVSGKIFYNDGIVSASHGFAIILIVFSFEYYFYKNNKLSSFDYVISLQDKNGDSPLKNSKINISYGSANNEVDINSKGEISIHSIPASYKNQDTYIQLSYDDDWQFNNGKKKDTLKFIGEKMTLIVEPEYSRCCLKGKIWFSDKKNHLLQGITIQAEELSVKTDINGNFILPLPEKLRLEKIIKIEAFSGKYKGSIYGNTASYNEVRLELTK